MFDAGEGVAGGVAQMKAYLSACGWPRPPPGRRLQGPFIQIGQDFLHHLREEELDPGVAALGQVS